MLAEREATQSKIALLAIPEAASVALRLAGPMIKGGEETPDERRTKGELKLVRQKLEGEAACWVGSAGFSTGSAGSPRRLQPVMASAPLIFVLHLIFSILSGQLEGWNAAIVPQDRSDQNSRSR